MKTFTAILATLCLLNTAVNAQTCGPSGTLVGSTCQSPYYICSTSQNTCLKHDSVGSDYSYMVTTTDYTTSANKFVTSITNPTINNNGNLVDTQFSWSLCPYGTSLLLTSNSGYCYTGSALKWFLSGSGSTNFITNSNVEGNSASLYITVPYAGQNAVVSSSSNNQFTILCPPNLTYSPTLGKCSGPVFSVFNNPSALGLSILDSPDAETYFCQNQGSLVNSVKSVSVVPAVVGSQAALFTRISGPNPSLTVQGSFSSVTAQNGFTVISQIICA
jgi:hypothetical protein